MTTESFFNVLSADKPLSDPRSDRLGYSPFAKHLAESISKVDPTDGFVIAVYGSWGSGKTTLMNFIAYYLKENPEVTQPVLVHL
jgi:predicted KAP-like P-loop ATPase